MQSACIYPGLPGLGACLIRVMSGRLPLGCPGCLWGAKYKFLSLMTRPIVLVEIVGILSPIAI